MNKIAKVLIAAIALTFIPMRLLAQHSNLTKVAELNIHNLRTIEERVALLHSIQEDDVFSYIYNESGDRFNIFIPNDYTCDSPNNSPDFDMFLENWYDEWVAYTNLDKNERGSLFVQWRYQLDDNVFHAINEDFHRQLRDGNATCDGALPFCTDNGLYQFPAGTDAGNLGSNTPPYYCSGFVRPNNEGTSNCLYTTPNPAFYYMQIDEPGNLNIYMYSTPSHDIDFDCWGPFTDINTACGQLSCSNMVDCSYSSSPTENCHINNAQTGQYYILLITNYSNATCNISFSNTGTGTTNCDILPPLVDNDGPYCVGETIHLTANGQAGSTYSWSGPGGFSSTQQNPNRPNCTMAMSGTYTCTITVGSQTNSATTEIVVHPQPTANFNATSVCVGNATQFTSTSTTNPSGQTISSYQWNFGDGQSGTGQSTTHTYASPGTYNATLTVQTSSNCTDAITKTVTVYAQPTATATATPNTVIYGGSANLNGSAGVPGTFNFHWEPANLVVNPNSQNTQTTALQQSQTFTLTVTNPQGGCSSTAQVTVGLEGSSLTATASAEDDDLCEGETTTLHALPVAGTGNYTYSWEPANTLDNPNSQNPVASPGLGATTYTCHISDGFTNVNASVTLQVHPLEVEHQYETICANDSYNFYGDAVSAPNTYEHHETTQYGCDRTIYLHLENWPVYDETVITEFICQGESYEFYGTQYTQTCQIPYTDHTTQHGCDSIVRLNLTVYPLNDTTLIDPSICIGQSYNFHGTLYDQDGAIAYFDTVDNHGCLKVEKLSLSVGEYQMPPVQYQYECYSHGTTPSWTWDKNGVTYHADTYDEIVLNDPEGGCDIKYRLNLRFHEEYYHVENKMACDSYTWPVNGVTYDESQNWVVETFHYDFGDTQCDSTYVLHLEISNFETNEVEINTCDEYVWLTDTLLQSDTYIKTFQNQMGCDSIVTLNLNLEYTPRPTHIYPVDNSNAAPHWVVTATEFQINSYEFNLWDSLHPAANHWESVRWSFVKKVDGIWQEDPDVLWILEPDTTTTPSGMRCMMYVINHISDTVWLEARAYNSCSQDGVPRRYWFVSSFYGIEEQNANPANFTVVPNPNKGQMTLSFEHFNGEVNIKVYDMRGALIDQFETYPNSVSNSYTYQMRNREAGIYFIVATGKEGIVAKKVVIQR